MINEINSGQLSSRHANQAKLRENIEFLKQSFKVDLVNQALRDNITGILDQLDIILEEGVSHVSSRSKPTRTAMSLMKKAIAMNRIIELFKPIDPSFLCDQLEILIEDPKKRKSKTGKLQQPLTQLDTVNGYHIPPGSDLGRLTAIGIALGESENNKKTSITSKKQKSIDTINALLKDGIDNMEELIKIMKLIGALGHKIPTALLDKLLEQLNKFIEKTLQDNPSFTDFMMIMQLIESTLGPKIADAVVNEIKPTITDISSQKDGSMQDLDTDSDSIPSTASILEPELELEPGLDLGADLEPGPEPLVVLEETPKTTKQMPLEIQQSAQRRDISPLKVDKIEPLDLLDREESNSKIREKLTEWIENNESLFSEHLLTLTNAIIEKLMEKTLSPLSKSFDELDLEIPLKRT